MLCFRISINPQFESDRAKSSKISILIFYPLINILQRTRGQFQCEGIRE